MNEGWVADWIANGASPPAVAPARERIAFERLAVLERLDAARKVQLTWHGGRDRAANYPWLYVKWGDHVVVGDVIESPPNAVEGACEVMSAVWDARSRLWFGLYGLDGELAGQCFRRQGREVYGRAPHQPWRLRWDDEGARAEAVAAAHREFEEAGDRYRRARWALARDVGGRK